MIPHIFLVDDEPMILDICKGILEEFHCKVSISSESVEGYVQLVNEKFDLIITDLKMPELNGEQLLDEIRFKGLNEKTPVIVLSGYMDKNIESNLDQFAPIKFMHKPFNRKDLIQEIQNLVPLEASA